MSQGDVVIIDTLIGIGHDTGFLYRGCNKMSIRDIRKNNEIFIVILVLYKTKNYTLDVLRILVFTVIQNNIIRGHAIKNCIIKQI